MPDKAVLGVGAAGCLEHPALTIGELADHDCGRDAVPSENESIEGVV